MSVPVLPGAEAYASFGNPACGVLCLHGFGGNPAEMCHFGTRLEAAGYSISIPRLPGHGTSLDDMLSTDRHDWLAAARVAYNEMAARCRQVHIAGLSMGGILALLLAAEYHPEKLVLISVPRGISNPAIYATPLLGRFIRVLPVSNPTLGINCPEQRARHVCYRDGVAVASIWQLHLLIRQGMTVLPRVTAPTLLMQSSGDRVIPADSAERIMQGLASATKRLIRYSASNHVIVRDYDREAAATAALDFLRPAAALA